VALVARAPMTPVVDPKDMYVVEISAAHNTATAEPQIRTARPDARALLAFANREVHIMGCSVVMRAVEMAISLSIDATRQW